MNSEKYTELYNYLLNGSNPFGFSANQKRIVRKGSKHYKIVPNKLMYFYNLETKPTIVIQQSEVDDVLKEVHYNCGHQCYRYTYNLAHDRYFWPGMTSTIKQYINMCDRCSRCEYGHRTPSEPLTPIQVISEPWYKVGMDLCKPKFPSSEYQYFLTVTDFLPNI